MTFMQLAISTWISCTRLALREQKLGTHWSYVQCSNQNAHETN